LAWLGLAWLGFAWPDRGREPYDGRPGAEAPLARAYNLGQQAIDRVQQSTPYRRVCGELVLSAKAATSLSYQMTADNSKWLYQRSVRMPEPKAGKVARLP